MPNSRKELRAGIARASRALKHDPSNDEAAVRLDAARRDYYAATLAEIISDITDKAPPLTNEQRARLAALLGSA